MLVVFVFVRGKRGEENLGEVANKMATLFIDFGENVEEERVGVVMESLVVQEKLGDVAKILHTIHDHKKKKKKQREREAQQRLTREQQEKQERIERIERGDTYLTVNALLLAIYLET